MPQQYASTYRYQKRANPFHRKTCTNTHHLNDTAHTNIYKTHLTD